jgi:hypothetical protein
MAHSKNKRKFPLKSTVAVLAAAWIAASFMLHLPPASWLQNPSDQTPEAMKEESTKPSFPEKPPFRFGSRTLARVCEEYGIDINTAVQDLAAFAIEAKPEWSIKRIANDNDMEQEALFEVIRELSLDREQPLDMLD